MAKSKTKRKKDEPDRTPEQTRREVIGVCLIALGLFLCASLYSQAVGIFGKAICEFIFGVSGIAGYALPVAVIIWGVLKIIFSEKPIKPLTTFLVCLFVVSLLSVLHVGMRGNIANVKVFEYYKDAYTFGISSRAGGGVIGALLAYPMLLLTGTVGSYIIFIAVMLVAFLLVTRLSLKQAGEKLGNEIKHGVENVNERMSERRNALYTEDVTTDVERKPVVVERKKPVKPQKPVQPTLPPFTIQGDEGGTGIYGRVKDMPDSLEVIPATGKLERKKAQEDKLANDFDQMQPELDEGRYFVSDANDDDPIESRITKNAPVQPKSRACKANVPIVEVTDAAEPEAANVEISPANADGSEIVREYQRPPYDLLNQPEKGYTFTESPQEKAKLLEDTLATFNVSAKVINYTVGPVITRFELQPAKGVRVNRITALTQDLAMALAAAHVRIEAPIPGKQAIGIEIPNKNTAMVVLREIIESREFQGEKSSIAFAIGKDIAGKIITADLDKMPHLLIAGTTGSGKSVCINDIIVSMAYKSSPEDLLMIMIDPKVVEMQMYASLPHLKLPVVTDCKKAAGALMWAVMEMERRYNLMASKNARDITRYNMQREETEEHLPKLVIIIDELADLMMVAAKDVEDSICRIAQKGRAAGIHLIVATQRPSTDVITGLIKANIPSRIALMVSSMVDSRVILDEPGAEKLLGNGDMLFHANGANKPIRAQAAFISDAEVERVMQFFMDHVGANTKLETDFESLAAASASNGNPTQGNGKQEDDLLPEAVKIVLNDGQASISMIQRKLRVGYARAARLIDIMETKKIVSASEGSKPRRVLITHGDYARMFGEGSNDGEVDNYEDAQQ